MGHLHAEEEASMQPRDSIFAHSNAAVEAGTQSAGMNIQSTEEKAGRQRAHA